VPHVLDLHAERIVVFAIFEEIKPVLVCFMWESMYGVPVHDKLRTTIMKDACWQITFHIGLKVRIPRWDKAGIHVVVYGAVVIKHVV
jgi:hypothetical protein